MTHIQLHVNKAKDGRKYVQLQKMQSKVLCFLTVTYEVFTAVKIIVCWNVMLWQPGRKVDGYMYTKLHSITPQMTATYFLVGL